MITTVQIPSHHALYLAVPINGSMLRRQVDGRSRLQHVQASLARQLGALAPNTKTTLIAYGNVASVVTMGTPAAAASMLPTIAASDGHANAGKALELALLDTTSPPPRGQRPATLVLIADTLPSDMLRFQAWTAQHVALGHALRIAVLTIGGDVGASDVYSELGALADNVCAPFDRATLATVHAAPASTPAPALAPAPPVAIPAPALPVEPAPAEETPAPAPALPADTPAPKPATPTAWRQGTPSARRGVRTSR